MLVSRAELLRSPGHAFDDKYGRPSLPAGLYFRMLLVGASTASERGRVPGLFLAELYPQPPRQSPADPNARIAKSDGRTHVAYKLEHTIDLDTGAVAAAEVQGRPGRHHDRERDNWSARPSISWRWRRRRHPKRPQD